MGGNNNDKGQEARVAETVIQAANVDPEGDSLRGRLLQAMYACAFLSEKLDYWQGIGFDANVPVAKHVQELTGFKTVGQNRELFKGQLAIFSQIIIPQLKEAIAQHDAAKKQAQAISSAN